MDPVPIKTLRFSTDDFPEQKRIDSYREVYSRTIVKHDVEPLGDQPFRFSAELFSLPGLGMASSFYTPCHRWHTAEQIDSDDLLFGVSLSGGCVVQQNGREAVIERRGEAVLASAAHPVDVVIGAAAHHVSLRLPRAILEARVADLDARIARLIPGDTEGLPLLTGYLGSLRLSELTNPVHRDLVVSHIYDLVALLLDAKGDSRHLAQQRGARAARRGAVLREIERRSADPNLSAITVAMLLGVTPRYVHLLMEETGKSFANHMMERRLERVGALLHDPRARHQKIAEIAAEAGFSDLSYFNRAFRRRFGATPTDVRLAAMEAARRE